MRKTDLQMSQVTIDAINGELAYQANMPITRADDQNHGLAGQLVALGVYTNEAQVLWAKNPGDVQALDIMRKVAAIAVRAMEEHGVVCRES